MGGDDILAVVSKLRQRGLGRHVNLPLMVLCGDRSTNRKSVLEVLCDAVFPDQKVCDQYRILVNTSPSPFSKSSPQDTLGDKRKKAAVTIVPSPKRSNEEQDRLRLFREEVESHTGGSIELDLCDAFNCVSDALGVKDDEGEYVHDVVRVEIRGPRCPYLSVSHLPGLLSPGDSATPSYTAGNFDNVVQRCALTVSAIIVPVISASRNAGQQRIVEIIRRTEGKRMLGIMLGTEDGRRPSPALGKNYCHYVQSFDHLLGGCVTLELGWFVKEWVKFGLRASKEEAPMLRSHACSKLWIHTQDYAFTLRATIKSEILECETLCESLESPEFTTAEYRRHSLADRTRFSKLVRTAVDALSPNPVCRAPGGQDWHVKRLAVELREIRAGFNIRMASGGQKRRLVGKIPLGTGIATYRNSNLKGNEMRRSELLSEISERLDHVKGRELPGSFNAQVLYDLFIEQSSPWEAIARSMAEQVIDAVRRSTREIARRVIEQGPSGAAVNLSRLSEPAIDRMRTELHAKISMFLEHYRRPVAFTKQLVDAVQEVQLARQKEFLTSSINLYFSTTEALNPPPLNPFEPKPPLIDTTGLIERLIDDTRKSAEAVCPESLAILDYLEAYYKITLERFIEDVGLVAVDMCVLQSFSSLAGPRSITDAEIRTWPEYKEWHRRRILDAEEKRYTLIASDNALSAFFEAEEKREKTPSEFYEAEYNKERAPPASESSSSPKSSTEEYTPAASEADETPKPTNNDTSNFATRRTAALGQEIHREEVMLEKEIRIQEGIMRWKLRCQEAKAIIREREEISRMEAKLKSGKTSTEVYKAEICARHEAEDGNRDSAKPVD
ncbi:dynamin family protein [Colletotrichum plurivorum]|uniref:Dynamin family protein n=1 Tax=Colletotrichum plurivorum TaxID=2175906 RepID=A0A8H6K355_9PEZI|nr:dynamin family protein [Colletotrichum plurivorum]